MVYYKLYKAGELIGLEATEDPAYIKWQEKNDMIIRCSEEEAEAIVSARDYNTIYLLPGKQLHGVETDLSAVIVTQAEYEEAQGDFPPEPEPEPEPDPDNPMSIQEMRERIAELTERVMNEARPFTATKTYQAGEIITDGARVYVADQVIVAGETVRPGVNCTETNIADVLNALQAQHDE